MNKLPNFSAENPKKRNIGYMDVSDVTPKQLKKLVPAHFVDVYDVWLKNSNAYNRTILFWSEK